MKDAILVHSDDYNGWVFDPSHPTQGRRFDNGLAAITMRLDEDNRMFDVIEPMLPTYEDLNWVHTGDYISHVTSGFSDEWRGKRPDLAHLAALFVGGTLTALDALKAEETLLAVNLPGAKHHAMADHSSGFCVFADFAIAAHMLANEGKRVAILDVDAHHGDGTEDLTYQNRKILTYSIHEWGIFPGTGRDSDRRSNVYNEPLAAYSTDADLANGVMNFVAVADLFMPDYIFVAGGADGHRNDPLSSLQYTLPGYREALGRVRSAFPTTPILFGGAGGYQPDGATPMAWAEMVTALAA